MAQQFQVRYIDDIDGTELGDEAHSISFAFEGREYAIDLSEENAEAFRAVMAPYIDAGRKVSSGKSKPARRASGKTPSDDTRAIREWARENGFTVSDRGRVPANVMEAYAAAN